MPQRSQLAGFRQHKAVCCDMVVRRPEESGYRSNKVGHVIEQIRRGENRVCFYRNQRLQAIEPALREGATFRPHGSRYNTSESGGINWQELDLHLGRKGFRGIRCEPETASIRHELRSRALQTLRRPSESSCTERLVVNYQDKQTITEAGPQGLPAALIHVQPCSSAWYLW